MSANSPKNAFLENFIKEVDAGLSSTPKRLPSKYFYDDEGSRLFQKIMHMPEYYLTNSEFEIFSEQGKRISELVFDSEKPIEIVELGAGDGLKTKVLLKYFLENDFKFTYKPVDISGQALKMLLERLNDELPDLEVETLEADYFEALSGLKNSDTRKVILFLGSNIGNFRQRNGDATKFLNAIGEKLNENDLLILGADLRKDPNIILKAYDDAHGITRAFNMNLMRRINTELKADFDLESFVHYPLYDIESGEARSYLLSKKKQTVNIGANNKAYHFEAWEFIHVEISQKYTQSDLKEMAHASNFVVSDFLMDCKHYYTDAVLKKR